MSKLSLLTLCADAIYRLMSILSHIIGASVVVTLVPAGVLAARRPVAGGHLAVLIGVPLAASLLWCGLRLLDGWRDDFPTTLWVTVSASLLAYGGLTLWSPAMRRLAPLMLPYLAALALMAAIWDHGTLPDATSSVTAGFDIWLLLHVVLAVLTYSLVSLAAVAAMAVALREYGLKSRKRFAFLDLLPPLAEAESLQLRLMAASELLLGAGVMTGMAAQVLLTGTLLELDHKVMLTLAAFVTIGILLVLQIRSGIRGRRAAQFVFLAYLLVTLGYPGVKFITDVLGAG